jgi:N-acetylglucosamine malate deacetylase 1
MSQQILVVAPHPDDETLGAGGTIAKFSSRGDHVFVLVVSGHLPPLYTREQYEVTVREANAAFGILGVAESRFLEVPATMVANQPTHVLNEQIARVVAEVKPDVVFCPFPDRHVDHGAIFESVMVATRPVGVGCNIELLAAYETLSETHWNAPHIEPNFVPNLVIDITAQQERKAQALGCYKSQIPVFPGARSVEAALALGKFRGTQAGFAFGEAFHVIRMRG